MPSDEQMQRLRALVPAAQSSMRKWHVPASVTLVQWIFESGWGMDAVAVKTNNCFGIKVRQRGGKEPYVECLAPEYKEGATVTHEEIAQFIRYPSVAASFDDHGRLLNTYRYAPALAYAEDPHAYLRAIQSAGYSTNPKYAALLGAEIDKLNLTQYDTLPPADAAALKVA